MSAGHRTPRTCRPTPPDPTQAHARQAAPTPKPTGPSGRQRRGRLTGRAPSSWTPRPNASRRASYAPLRPRAPCRTRVSAKADTTRDPTWRSGLRGCRVAHANATRPVKESMKNQGGKMDTMITCEDCGRNVCGGHVPRCPNCGRNFCMRRAARDLAYKCADCGAAMCGGCHHRCEDCEGTYCADHIDCCVECGRFMCAKCARHCEICGDTICELDETTCAECGRHTCFPDSEQCIRCGKRLCAECMRYYQDSDCEIAPWCRDCYPEGNERPIGR